MRQVMRFAAVVALVSVFGCNESKPEGSATPEAKPSAAVSSQPAAGAAPSAEAPKAAPSAAAPAESAAAAPAESAAAAPAESAAAATSANASAPAASAAAGPKTFDCGAKGQKACPMQGWMKGVIGPHTSAGDAEKMAKDLQYIASKPPPGMGSWASIANAGAAKAKAGDVDGAKASCKQCHDQYKEKYKTTMRDRPW